jgi:hypothetical protein
VTLTAPPRQSLDVDAGVIEEARARQRRHRGIAVAAAVVAAIAALTLASVGGQGISHPARASGPPGRTPSKTPPVSLAACVARPGAKAVTKGTPSQSLLSILGVLRRAATPADALPESTSAALGRLGRFEVYVNYVRRARVIAGIPYYVWPVLYTGCGALRGTQRETMMTQDGRGGFGGAGDAAVIEQGRSVRGSGSASRSTLQMLVPDGVATVTLHYPASKIDGADRHRAPAFTTTTKVVGNFVVIAVPRGRERLFQPVTMTWRAADGHVIKTFNRL